MSRADERRAGELRANDLRDRIRGLVGKYYREAFVSTAAAFVPGSSSVPISGRVFDEQELELLVESSLDFWLTTGRFAEQFEREFAKFVGVRETVLVNSGSSANLLAVTALTSPKLGDRRLRPGDEVITLAAGFPTTVNPILQNGLVPVFVDVQHSYVQRRCQLSRSSIINPHACCHLCAYVGESLRS